MGWNKHNAHLSYLWRNRRFRFSLYSPHRWGSLHTRDSRESSQSGIRSPRDRKRNRRYLNYYVALCLLAIAGAPVRAEDAPETQNVSAPRAAATGNVSNQAIQFQNNGAPSRQQMGPSINCNPGTVTFSPFYMGNHVTPFDDRMDQQSYTVSENWGAQLNFMLPLDGSIVERCKSIAARQEEKMKLNFELVRIDNCTKFMQRGFMLRPGTRVAKLCQDVIPISQWKAEIEAKRPKPPPPKKSWWQLWKK